MAEPDREVLRQEYRLLQNTVESFDGMCRNEWKSGKFHGNPPCFKFEYCTSMADTFKTIAWTVQGSTSPNGMLRVAKDLSWRDIAQFNYGTAFNEGKSEIRVRNPWGEDPSGAPTPSGQVIPFSDFMQVFSNVNYEE